MRCERAPPPLPKLIHFEKCAIYSCLNNVQVAMAPTGSFRSVVLFNYVDVLELPTRPRRPPRRGKRTGENLYSSYGEGVLARGCGCVCVCVCVVGGFL